MTATLEELRELSARSRRARSWGVVSLLATLALFPVVALVAGRRPDWATAASYVATAAAGLLLVGTTFVAGQERGAFRRVMRRVKREMKKRDAPAVEGPADVVA